MAVTLKDIAKESGFSITQVSRALAGYDDVNEKTRAHIIKIAGQLGYQPNYIARQLQSQRTNTIGIVMPRLSAERDDDFFTVLLKGITHEASHMGYDVLVSASNHTDSELETYKRLVGGRRVDGVIVARTSRNDQRIAYLKDANFPFIVHGRLAPDESSDFSYIDVDSQLGVAMLTEHLVEQGHRNIGIILPPQHLAFTLYRLAGYREVLAHHKIAVNESHCVYGDMTHEGGVDAAATLLDRHPDLTAIIGCNDWMALGALSVAKERGYAVGEAFGVVGYDDIPGSLYAVPSLTTIHQSIFDNGKLLTRELIQIIDQPTAELTQRLVKPKLIVRESSGKSRQRKESA